MSHDVAVHKSEEVGIFPMFLGMTSIMDVLVEVHLLTETLLVSFLTQTYFSEKGEII